MRGSIGRRISYHPIGASVAIKSSLIPYPEAPFSSFSGEGDGRGRGRGYPIGESSDVPNRSIFSREERVTDLGRSKDETVSGLPPPIRGGIGRGKTTVFAKPPDEGEMIHEENRHLRSARGRSVVMGAGTRATSTAPKMSHDEAVSKAVELLSRAGRQKVGPGIKGGEGRGGGEREGRGRGRGGFGQEEWRDPVTGLYRGDPAVNKENMKKFAKLLGPEAFDQFIENLEKAHRRHFSAEEDDKRMQELDFELRCLGDRELKGFTKIGCPDINDAPPISLEDFLRYMKEPILECGMSHEEFEQAVKELKGGLFAQMEKAAKAYVGKRIVPASEQLKAMKDIVKRLPENAPASVEDFANRSITALHRNPNMPYGAKRKVLELFVKTTQKFYGSKRY